MSFENGFERLQKELSAVKETDALKRLAALFDNGVFTELDRFSKNGGAPCEVVTACGSVSGMKVYAFSQDSSVSGGAMGRAQAEKIKRVYKLASMTGAPVIGIYDSMGAHMNEGMDALAAYGELILAANNISGVVPQISLVLGSCIGSAAILANLADVVIMSKNAELCVSSAFVVDDKDNKVGTAETAAGNGTASIVAENEEDAVKQAALVVSMLPQNNLSVAMIADYVPAVQSDNALESLVDAGSFVEFNKGFGPCTKIGLARIAGNVVGIVATAPNKDGRMCHKCASKIARFVRMCDSFSLPVVTLLDAAGFKGNKESELSGDIKVVSRLTHAYSEATTAKITVITGKAYGAVYTAMAGKASNADVVFAWPDAQIAAMEPKTAVQFLYKERLKTEKREDLETEYINTVASAFEAAANGHIDDVITKAETPARVIEALEMLCSKRVSTMDKKHSNMPL
ncbi:MAG: carboxyl transferase domain-containing protein [Oscillospiraceae bacterium]